MTGGTDKARDKTCDCSLIWHKRSPKLTTYTAHCSSTVTSEHKPFLFQPILHFCLLLYISTEVQIEVRKLGDIYGWDPLSAILALYSSVQWSSCHWKDSRKMYATSNSEIFNDSPHPIPLNSFNLLSRHGSRPVPATTQALRSSQTTIKKTEVCMCEHLLVVLLGYGDDRLMPSLTAHNKTICTLSNDATVEDTHA